MKKKIRILSFLLATLIVMSATYSIPVMAGMERTTVSFMDNAGDLNKAEWHSTDPSIVCKNKTLYIPEESSTGDTKLITKKAASITASDEVIGVDTSFRITSLPQGQRLVLGLGLSSVEPSLGESGNVEISFANEGGIVVSVKAYGEAGEQVILKNKKSGSSLNKTIHVEATILSQGVLNLELNGSSVCKAQLPVDGSGRFGIMQTGSCGVEFTKLLVNYSNYATPENTNIVEDFENGELNSNVLCAKISTAANNLPTAYSAIEDYNGSKVLMFHNAGLGWICTLYPYSNFELVFDVPYFQHQNVYDEKGTLELIASNFVCVSFGEEIPISTGYSCVDATDMWAFGTSSAHSEVRKTFETSYDTIGCSNICGDTDKNQGYTVKMTMIDGVMTGQIKPLSGGSFKTVATQKYDTYRGGYVYIWSMEQGNFAIDNLKITNMDKGAKLIDVEYESSLITAEDYVPTEEEQQLVFRETEVVEDTQQKKMSGELLFFLCCVGGAVILIGVGTGVIITSKQKRKREGMIDENKTE